ncbi:helix-turn-helix transcriptional regulator [Planococcus sp. CP5-4]|uniref:helix-turn-helix transcriptional regulator n=1 Tax=unclassified Planococcus (in: firmicutes) TaxID=2662419 RepID=UPI001C23BE3B|nr:helix-turn-helix transcriptional regulator [Planococcus sp. CP5-4]MBU9674476.1 helix-turn-helix transcriptional regulator [Planococcus sp. CP5-4_YE]MBV0910107.1 helix-turn-helix transcriptional regulator [Planococcus sp. CP5-4_UN]MBW6064685.1 helix-turn-helix transcriptional regulator [Planococcus sp. CP5-4]
MDNKLKELRETHGFSQDQLAKKLGVSRQTIISIEKGRYNPSLPLALQMGRIFTTPVENIFFLEEESD